MPSQPHENQDPANRADNNDNNPTPPTPSLPPRPAEKSDPPSAGEAYTLTVPEDGDPGDEAEVGVTEESTSVQSTMRAFNVGEHQGEHLINLPDQVERT